MTTTALDTITDLEVATVLDDSADLIERDGWTQGAFEDIDGCRCALGAIGAATKCHPTFSPSHAFNAARDALAAAIGPNVHETERQAAVVNWNDDMDRTVQQVTATMRQTATAIRHQAA